MAKLPPKRADHASLQRHRRELWVQILLPVMVASVLLLGTISLASVAALRGTGDVARWTAISTIWLAIPGIVMELVLLALVAVMIYLVSRVARLIPPYSWQAQQLLHRVETATRRGAQMVRRPASAVQAFAAFVRGRLERKPERT